jgi:hypothetical protein
MSGIPGTISVPRGGKKYIPEPSFGLSGRLVRGSVLGPTRADERRYEVFKTEPALKERHKGKPYPFSDEDKDKATIRAERMRRLY